MNELLELCGFEPHEIETERTRIERAFARLNITEEDIEVGKQRLRQYYQIDLKGFRMVLKICMRELVNLVLAKEEKRKIIYTSLPSVITWLVTSGSIADPTVYTGLPELLIMFTYGSIFNKMEPVTEAAEQDVLIPDGAQCGCTQAKLGLQLLGLKPDPDLILSWAIYCDESPKVDAYIKEKMGIPIVTINRIMDTNHNEEEAPEREISFFAQEMRRACEAMSETMGVTVTDEHVWQSLIEAAQSFGINEQLLNLNIASDLVPLSDLTLWYVFSLSILGVSRENVPLVSEAMTQLLEDTQALVEKGEGWFDKGAPRVAIVTPSCVDSTFSYLLKEVGLSVPVFEAIWFCPDAALKPNLGTQDELDPFKVMAKAFSIVTLTAATQHRIAAMNAAAKRHRLDGFLGNPHYSCRPLVSDGFILKDAFRKDNDLPAAVVEYDYYDSRHYTAEALRTRIESFAELCKIKAMTNAES